MLVGLVSILALALGCGAAIRLSGGGQPKAVASAPAKAGALSPPATLAISRGLGADLAGYRLERSAGGFLARNARQHLTASFGARGATVSTRGGAHSSIALQAIGSGAALHAVGLAQPLARDNRVEYRRGAATEWFANGPAGVEQGFTIGTKPAGVTSNGALTLALGFSGTLAARPSADGGLVLTGAGGKAMLRYGDLSVTDARGRTLPAHMTVEHGRVLIGVDARGARYPLTVDPLLNQVGELYASEGEKEDQFGGAIAASGGTVVVGESLDTVAGQLRSGAAYVFIEGAGGWATATQKAKLIASNPEKEEALGASVAISGKTIVVGAPGRSSGSGVDAGGAYVYSEPASGWGEKAEQTEAAELYNSEDVALYSFGTSVAISGETIVVGTPFYRDYVQNPTTPHRDGAAFVFQEPAGGWASEPHHPEYQTATLVPHEAEVEDLGHFGQSVAIGTEGGEQSVVVGAPVEPVGTEADKYQHGIVFIFSRPAGGWGISGERFPQAQLTASDGTEFANLGESVSLSGDTLAAGAPRAEVASVKQGATYIFTAPSGGWASEPEQHDVAKLTTPGGIEGDQYGESVALEGSTVVSVGAGRKAYLFAMPSSGWSGEINPSSEFEGKIYTAGIDGGEALLGALTAKPPGGAGGVNQGAVDIVPFAPAAVTGPASVGTETTTVVEGTVNPDQTKISSCSFQYGISATYGSEVSCASFPATGVTASTVTATLAGLAPGTTYHYRVLSTNEVDTSYGADETFTTPSGKGIEATPEEKSTGGGSITTGITTTTVASTGGGGAPVAVASSPKAVEELLLGCGSSQLVLNDAYIHGGRVLLSGSAAKSFVGKRVKILFNEGKQVASATVGASGAFATTAPLPPAKIREALSTRYSAEIGKVRSLHLKLTRRLLLEPPKASGTTVTLSGQVTLPLTKPVTPVVVEQQLECGKTTVVKTFIPSASGHFNITLTVPATARAGIYRLTSKVAANAHAVKHGFTTFSLPLPVALG
jgi:hypothetical protein